MKKHIMIDFEKALQNPIPKISFLRDKYKIYLLKIYDKFKSSWVNIKINYKDKFSIVNDILTFCNIFNNKYKQTLDFNVNL